MSLCSLKWCSLTRSDSSTFAKKKPLSIDYYSPRYVLRPSSYLHGRIRRLPRKLEPFPLITIRRDTSFVLLTRSDSSTSAKIGTVSIDYYSPRYVLRPTYTVGFVDFRENWNRFHQLLFAEIRPSSYCRNQNCPLYITIRPNLTIQGRALG